VFVCNLLAVLYGMECVRDEGANRPMHPVLLYASATDRDQALQDALRQAVYEDKHEELRQILEATGSCCIVDSLGQAPLHWAARRGSESAARVLLDHKALVNVKSNDGTVPLHFAAMQDMPAVVKLLTAHRAEITQQDAKGKTPLFAAAEVGAVSAVSALLASTSCDSVNLEMPNNYGDTPLACAVARGHETVTKVLLHAQANANSHNRWKQCPLQLAVKKCKATIIEMLLKHGRPSTSKRWMV